MRAHSSSSEALSEEAARDVGAIGFVGMPYVNKNAAVVIGSSCGIIGKASKFSVKIEDYPLARRLYLYTIGAPADPAARDFLRYALSDEAQPNIDEAEFVDQSVMFEDESEQSQWASAFVSGSARCWAFAREMPRCGVDARLNPCPFTPINNLQLLKC